jgi:DNA-binding transcriptional MerR regulator
MFIGELAARAGVSVQAERLYEQRGLMRAAERTAAGYRVYGPFDLELLETIVRCKALGLTLAETRRVARILMDDHAGDNCLREIEAIGIEKRAALEDRIRELMAAKDALDRTLGQIRNSMAALDPLPR